MDTSYRIYRLDEIHLEEALELVWAIFLEFEAPEYCEEGIQEFKDFIEYGSIKSKIENGEFYMWVCFFNDKIVGVLGARKLCHISLLFVDKEHHKKGIARRLVNESIEFFKATGEREMTVNSSPYAVDIYHKMGFTDTDSEQLVNGIRFTPMKRTI